MYVLQVCGPCNVHVCAHTAQRWQLVVSVPGSSSSGRVISNYQITHVCVLYSKVCITNTKQQTIEHRTREQRKNRKSLIFLCIRNLIVVIYVVCSLLQTRWHNTTLFVHLMWSLYYAHTAPHMTFTV